MDFVRLLFYFIQYVQSIINSEGKKNKYISLQFHEKCPQIPECKRLTICKYFYTTKIQISRTKSNFFNIHYYSKIFYFVAPVK